MAVFMLMLYSSCKMDQKKKVDPNQPNYSTTDDSELFFRNLRQVYYDKIEMKEAKLNQFRLGDRLADPKLPVLNLCIVENWRFDEAYILVEPGNLLSDEDTLFIQWADSALQTSGS